MSVLPPVPDPSTHRTARDESVQRALALRDRVGVIELTAWLRAAHLAGVAAPGADLRGLDLSALDLSWSRLDGAELAGAKLVRAGLEGARLHGARLEGADLTGATLDKAHLATGDLTAAKLVGASVVGADLTGATLDEASLRGATLLDAVLGGASLRRADLAIGLGRCADLSGAVLRGVDLTGANLTAARLHRTDLRDTRLHRTLFFGADVREASLTGASVRRADFTRANLLDVRDLPADFVETARVAEATLDWRTVARHVHRDGIGSLLLATGMPHVSATYLVDSLRSVDAADLFTMLQSVFLSYGQPDLDFADGLRTALSESGVKTWYYPVDAKPGEAILAHIDREIDHFDRMVVCCSRSGLVRPGVLFELEAVLARERADGRSRLLPVLVDDVFETGADVPAWWPAAHPDVYASLYGRVCADFRGRPPGTDGWRDELARVLVALRRPPD